MIVFFCGVVGSVFLALKHSEAYQLGVAKLEASPVAVSLLGRPISAGYPTGSIAIENRSRKASLSFSARGPRATGIVFLEAIKKDGVWSITRLALKLDGHDDVIDLIGARNST